MLRSLITSFLFTAVAMPLASPAQGNALTPASSGKCIPAGTLAGWRSAPLVSPELQTDGRVTLRLCGPNARSVRVLGAWNSSKPDGDALTQDERGVWSITVGPLKPEFYEYSFTVDGVKAIDPSNVHAANDAIRVGSYFIVPGEGEAALYENKDVPHGDVAAVWYPAKAAQSPRRALVYTPPGYRSSTKRLPVLYLLHGWGGDENEWLDMGRTAQIMNNMLAAGKISPMIVVLPNGHPDRRSVPDITPPASIDVLGPLPPRGYDSSHVVEQIEGSLVGDLVPYMDRNFRTIAKAESRAIVGLSMGGGEAGYTGLRHPDTFAWVGMFSAAVVMWPGAMAAALVTADSSALAIPRYGLNLDALNRDVPGLDASLNSKLKMLYISCGTEDGLITSNLQFEGFLADHKVRFTHKEVAGYAHVWSFWRRSLVDLAPMLFR